MVLGCLRRTQPPRLLGALHASVICDEPDPTEILNAIQFEDRVKFQSRHHFDFYEKLIEETESN
jgi:hypothetical protein